MQIVGTGSGQDSDAVDVHTIDVWFSKRRRVWVVERLDADGNQIGAAFRCEGDDQAAACLAEWLRAHDKTYLVSPHAPRTAEKRVLIDARQRRRAA